MANGKDDSVFVFIFLMAILWGGGWLVWKGFRPQITEGIMTVRSAQFAVADLWMDDNDIVRVPMPSKVDDEGPLKAKLGDNEGVVLMETKWGTWKNYVRSANVENVQNQHIRVMTYVALWPLRWIIAGIMVVLFVWVIFNGPTSKFRRVLGLEALMVDQARMFPVIRPFLAFNPNTLPPRPPGSAVPVDLPMFAEALEPEEWIAIHEAQAADGKLDRVVAERAFAKQLGPRWKGVSGLPAELQVLLACFCLKAARKRKEADDMLGRLSCCWDHKGGLKLSRDRALVREAKKILRNKSLSEKTISNCNRHAYVSTAMIRALNTAREEGGVLAPAQFVWLRAHNRALWYPLNNLGRQAFHVEAVGCAAHYRAEKQINRPIAKPRVTDAVDGLVEFLSNQRIVRPIPPVDGKKKKAA